MAQHRRRVIPWRRLAGDAQTDAPGVNPTRAWVGEHARGMRKALVVRGRLFGARTGLVAERGGASSPASGVVRGSGATA